jgi:hypothetical protein
MSEPNIARDIAWAATFDVLHCLLPAMPAEQAAKYFEPIRACLAVASEAAFAVRAKESTETA